jgi:hypothetical protein
MHHSTFKTLGFLPQIKRVFASVGLIMTTTQPSVTTRQSDRARSLTPSALAPPRSPFDSRASILFSSRFTLTAIYDVCKHWTSRSRARPRNQNARQRISVRCRTDRFAYHILQWCDGAQQVLEGTLNGKGIVSSFLGIERHDGAAMHLA